MFKKIMIAISSFFVLQIALAVIGALIIFSFFGGSLTVKTFKENMDYAKEYRNVLNKYFEMGYVPLERILYFYFENDLISFDTYYLKNLKDNERDLENIYEVCKKDEIKDFDVCEEDIIEESEIDSPPIEKKFNFPLNTNDYYITSFFGEERIVFDEINYHKGWDFATQEQTPVYSVCNGTVKSVVFTQKENKPFDVSMNSIGNTITISCDDYDEDYDVIFMHLYPESSKVKVGDKVEHFTEIASVGTTGYSTGNHLHYQVNDKTGEVVDGMLFINLDMKKQEVVEESTEEESEEIENSEMVE